MTLGRLAAHVAQMPEWGVMTMDREVLELAPDAKPWVAGSRAEIAGDVRQERAGGAGEDRGGERGGLEERLWTLIWGGKAVIALPRGTVMRSMVMNHLIHHRAQLGGLFAGSTR